jgi:two-component system, LytTR family, response regulator
MTIKILVVEDEVLAAQKLEILVREVLGFEVVGHSRSGHEALIAIRDHSPDLVLLDIQLPDMTGFDILEELQKLIATGNVVRAPRVVFITAHDDWAVRAFQIHAIDYLLKPFAKDRLHEALERVQQDIGAERTRTFSSQLIEAVKEIQSAHKYARRLVFKSNGRLVILRASDIRWAHADGNYIRLYSGKESHLLRETIQNMEQHLDPDMFLRIHRSAIVNLDEVARVVSTESGDSVVKLRDGTELRMSRSYRNKALQLLGQQPYL